MGAFESEPPTDQKESRKNLRIIAWMPLPMLYKEEQLCSEKMDEDI